MMTMIECPRCGFSQPKDQYCASCGVNMDQLLAKPKPLGTRLLQNPNFHLSLIGLLIVVVVGWIVYSQSTVVSREVHRLLDLPVSSKNAGDPNEARTSKTAASGVTSAGEVESADELDSGEDGGADSDSEPASGDGSVAGGTTEANPAALAGPGAGAAKTADAQRLELGFWEVPREALLPMLQGAQRVGYGNGGRAYLFAQATKVTETLQTGAQPLGAPRSAALAQNAQITVETPPTAAEMFQFALLNQVTKFDKNEASIRWEASFVYPQTEQPGSDSVPAMRAVQEAGMSGTVSLPTAGALVLILEPLNRNPREEAIVRAGEGPWSIFSSPDFRGGATELVMVLQLK